MAPTPQTLIDRDPQVVPIPLGSTNPVHLARRRVRRPLRTHGPSLLTTCGLLAAVAGVVLLCLPSPTEAYLDGNAVHIGAMTLTEVGPGAVPGSTVYSGEASYVLLERLPGSPQASASWTAHGVVMSAHCSIHVDHARVVDECSFAAQGVTSIDVLQLAGSKWQRTYSDGVRVSIDVPNKGAAVPVPFPLGR